MTHKKAKPVKFGLGDLVKLMGRDKVRQTKRVHHEMRFEFACQFINPVKRRYVAVVPALCLEWGKHWHAPDTSTLAGYFKHVLEPYIGLIFEFLCLRLRLTLAGWWWQVEEKPKP